MRSGDEFRSTIRRGAKGVQPTLVTHLVPGSSGTSTVGFVVSKAVGPAVDRNRVKRQLRHLMRDRLEGLPDGSRLVVRALPSASQADHRTLSDELDAALTKSGAR